MLNPTPVPPQVGGWDVKPILPPARMGDAAMCSLLAMKWVKGKIPQTLAED